MKLPETGFWKRQEIANQFVHFGISFLSGLALYWMIRIIFHRDVDIVFFIGAVIGAIVETIQASKLTEAEAKERIPDDIRDL